MPESSDPLFDPLRIAAVESILPGQVSDPEFDRLTRLASTLLKVPTCLISLVTSDRQEFKGACGLPSELREIRSTPLSHSFCKMTVATGELLLVENAPEDPRVADNPVLEAVGLKSYLGFPLIDSAGRVLGAFCLIDYVPRQWTEAEIDAVRDFAGLAVDLIEAAMTESRATSSFDIVLHDLRSPLSGALMATSLLMEQSVDLPDPVRTLVQSIHTSTEAAVNLVQTLSIQDRTPEECICHHPDEVLRIASSRLSEIARAKGMTLKISTAPAEPLSVAPWVLERILENLISNAVKYAPPHSTVEVSYHCEASRGLFYVCDQGPGFSVEDRKRMYQRYTRLSAQPTGEEHSTGMGLSIVKRLASHHRGSVDLISPPGAGAHFMVAFPRRRI